MKRNFIILGVFIFVALLSTTAITVHFERRNKELQTSIQESTQKINDIVMAHAKEFSICRKRLAEVQKENKKLYKEELVCMEAEIALVTCEANCFENEIKK